MPLFKGEIANWTFYLYVSIIIGLLGSDAYALARNNSWNKKGKFVKEVVSAMACMGNIIPATERSRVVNLELASGKFDKPLSAMKGGDYAKMDIIGRIGCHCLLLLNCTNTFKAPDQVLSESAAKTLVGSLVYLSYEMFEVNHLLRLGILLGVVCDFEPVWPLKAEGRDLTHLLTFIRVSKKAELSRLDDKSIEKEEFLKTEGPKEFECGVGVCGSWLREQLALQLNSIWSSNGNAAAAQWTPLLHYLYPCYIHLYEEQPPIEECLGLFFVLIHQLMSSHKDILKENDCTRDVKMIELQINITTMHNKILQVMNSTIDQMNGDLSHKLAEIFLSTNWCFDNSSNNELSKTLVTKAMNNYSNLWRLHYNMLTTLLLKLTGINIVYDKDYIFKTRAPALSKPFEALFMVHRAVDQMYCALRHEVPVNRTAEFKVAMFEVSTIETTLHPLRSYFYYNLSRFSRCDVDEVMFLYTCSKDYWTFWQALCNARRLISQEMAMASIKLPNDSFGKCVAAFIRGDFEKTNLLIKPIIPFVLLADDVSEIYKMATDMTVEFPLMENGQQVVNEEDLSSLRDCKFWTSSSSDGGKKKPVKAKKSFKPPKEVIEALREAQKQQSKALQEAQKPQKEIEEHTCNTCKKSVNKKFLTCGECIKTGFPNVNYYCSKSCQTAAWETFHEEEHLISELEKSFNSMN